MTSPMHVTHDGPPGAPPLLLIHGSGASGAFWEPMIPALTAHHHVIRVDLPGHGRSATADSYGVPDQADRLAAALDAHGINRVAVATHSSGGYIATALTERRPGIATSLTLISCGPHIDAILPEPPILRLLLAPPAGPILWKLRTPTLIRKGIAATCARPIHLPDDAVDDLRRIHYRTLRTVLDRNTAYLTERPIPDRLATVGIPVQAIFGAADPRWDPASAHDYATIPQARIELLPGVGHVPMLEAPDDTTKLLLAFTTA